MDYCALCGNWIEGNPQKHWEKCKAGDHPWWAPGDEDE